MSATAAMLEQRARAWAGKDAVLRALWADRASAAAIAEALGTTMGAVLSRAKRLGLPRRERLPAPTMARFETKYVVDDATGCHLWLGTLVRDGYGVMSVVDDAGRSAMKRAHRIAYESARGPIPDGLGLDHLCRVRHCVNPDHLEPVTDAENARRSPVALTTLNRAKTHCKWGHPFAGENLRVDAKGKRQCKACDRELHRRRARRCEAA